VLFITAIVSLAVAAPAGAYLRDFTSTQVLTPSNSNTIKSLNFVCPGGKTAIGTGAGIPLISNLGIDNLWVFFGQKAVFDGAAETDSESLSWALTDRAWCATSTAVKPNTGGAATYIKNVTIVRNQSSSNSNYAKSVVAKCPAESPTAIGGGGKIEGSNDVAFDQIQRLSGGTQLRIKAHEVDATTASWDVEAHAICANTTSAVATNTYADAVVSQESAVGLSSLNKSTTANCPAGKFAVGGGALLAGPGLNFPPPDPNVVITESRPAGDSTAATGWTASAVETDPTGATWRLQVRAVCAALNAPPA
jgi:hypothetical protein